MKMIITLNKAKPARKPKVEEAPLTIVRHVEWEGAHPYVTYFVTSSSHPTWSPYQINVNYTERRAWFCSCDDFYFRHLHGSLDAEGHRSYAGLEWDGQPCKHCTLIEDVMRAEAPLVPPLSDAERIRLLQHKVAMLQAEIEKLREGRAA